MGHDWKSKNAGPTGVLDRGTLVIIQILSLLSKGNGLGRRIRS